jgi:SAM-dependent methyltransferase
MTLDWKKTLLAGPGGLPDVYVHAGPLLGRRELVGDTQARLWSDSAFVARARLSHTTSAVEARMRRRHLERMLRECGLDRSAPVLDLGCADGTFTHDLLALGFEKIVSTDLLPNLVGELDRSLPPAARDRVLLIVDDMHKLPFAPSAFGTVIAWGILSVSGDFEGALERAWKWLKPGGHLLFAEPLLEQALAYAVVRGDLAEFRRIASERTRAAMWEKREERYGLRTLSSYAERLARIPGAKVVASGGINMLPSLMLGGLLQDRPVPDAERLGLAQLLGGPAFDDVALWRQAFWLLRKA